MATASTDDDLALWTFRSLRNGPPPVTNPEMSRLLLTGRLLGERRQSEVESMCGSRRPSRTGRRAAIISGSVVLNLSLGVGAVAASTVVTLDFVGAVHPPAGGAAHKRVIDIFGLRQDLEPIGVPASDDSPPSASPPGDFPAPVPVRQPAVPQRPVAVVEPVPPSGPADPDPTLPITSAEPVTPANPPLSGRPADPAKPVVQPPGRGEDLVNAPSDPPDAPVDPSVPGKDVAGHGNGSVPSDPPGRPNDPSASGDEALDNRSEVVVLHVASGRADEPDKPGLESPGLSGIENAARGNHASGGTQPPGRTSDGTRSGSPASSTPGTRVGVGTGRQGQQENHSQRGAR